MPQEAPGQAPAAEATRITSKAALTRQRPRQAPFWGCVARGHRGAAARLGCHSPARRPSGEALHTTAPNDRRPAYSIEDLGGEPVAWAKNGGISLPSYVASLR